MSRQKEGLIKSESNNSYFIIDENSLVKGKSKITVGVGVIFYIFRQKYGLTRPELAKKLNVNNEKISYFENLNRTIKKEELRRLKKIFSEYNFQISEQVFNSKTVDIFV